MKLHAPQLIFLATIFMNVGINLAKDGEPAEPYSFGISVLSAFITIGLLWWGGFFRQGGDK